MFSNISCPMPCIQSLGTFGAGKFALMNLPMSIYISRFNCGSTDSTCVNQIIQRIEAVEAVEAVEAAASTWQPQGPLCVGRAFQTPLFEASTALQCPSPLRCHCLALLRCSPRSSWPRAPLGGQRFPESTFRRSQCRVNSTF